MMPNGPSQLLQSNCARMLRRAWRAHEHGEFDKAERFYTAILHIHPDHFDAMHGLGLINYRRGRLDAALALILPTGRMLPWSDRARQPGAGGETEQRPERPAEDPGPAGRAIGRPRPSSDPPN